MELLKLGKVDSAKEEKRVLESEIAQPLGIATNTTGLFSLELSQVEEIDSAREEKKTVRVIYRLILRPTNDSYLFTTVWYMIYISRIPKRGRIPSNEL